MRYTFRKNERLCSKKLIEQLFSSGKSFLTYPVKVTYCLQDNPSSPPAQVLILVSRKRFRKAFRRNRIKRLLREAYRLEKHQFYNYLNNIQKNCLIAISYVADNELSLDEIRKSIRTSLQKICDNDASKNSMA